MEQLQEWGLLLTAILLVAVMGLWLRGLNWEKKYKRMLAGSGQENLPELVIELQERLTKMDQAFQRQNQTLEEVEQQLGRMKGHVVLSRYNAFSDSGSDLSFTVGILDDRTDGVILTGIHSREETRLYAKPVSQGESAYGLSPEEKQVIAQASAERKRKNGEPS